MGSNPRVEAPYDLAPTTPSCSGVDFQQGFGDGAWEHTPDAPAAVATFRAAASAWRGAGGHVVMVREIYYPTDCLGADGEPIAHIVAHHPLMSRRENAEFYPGLVEPGDSVLRKTGYSALASGNLLETLAAHGSDTAVMAGLTTPICVGTTLGCSRAWPASRWSSGGRLRLPVVRGLARRRRRTLSRSPASATCSGRP